MGIFQWRSMMNRMKAGFLSPLFFLTMFSLENISIGGGVMNTSWGEPYEGLRARIGIVSINPKNEVTTVLAKLEIQNQSDDLKRIYSENIIIPIYVKEINQELDHACSTGVDLMLSFGNEGGGFISLYSLPKDVFDILPSETISLNLSFTFKDLYILTKRYCYEDDKVKLEFTFKNGYPPLFLLNKGKQMLVGITEDNERIVSEVEYDKKFDINLGNFPVDSIWTGTLETGDIEVPAKMFGITRKRPPKADEPTQCGNPIIKREPEIVEKDDLVYKKGESAPYTGMVLTVKKNSKSEDMYKDGKPNGRSTSWNADGNKALEIDFADGHAMFITKYFLNGQAMWKRGCGRNNGIFHSWYEKTGGKKHEVVPIEGNPSEKRETWWDEDGHVIAKGVLKDGKPWDGTFILFREKTLKTFKDGKEVESKPYPNPPNNEPVDY